MVRVLFVHLAMKKRTIQAIVKRILTAVKTPTPVRLIFIATAFAPNRTQRKMVKNEAPIGSSFLDSCGSGRITSFLACHNAVIHMFARLIHEKFGLPLRFIC